jgi:hypothetical protein
MTNQTRREVIKALACGKAENEIISIMGVTSSDIKSVTQGEIDDEKAHLKERGYI